MLNELISELEIDNLSAHVTVGARLRKPRREAEINAVVEEINRANTSGEKGGVSVWKGKYIVLYDSEVAKRLVSMLNALP